MLGRAEVVDGALLDRPKDFAEKNALPLQELHDVLKALLFPESVAEHERFDLAPDDYLLRLSRDVPLPPTRAAQPNIATPPDIPRPS